MANMSVFVLMDIFAYFNINSRKSVCINLFSFPFQYSHESINPFRIVAVGPDLNFMEPHNREKLGH